MIELSTEEILAIDKALAVLYKKGDTPAKLGVYLFYDDHKNRTWKNLGNILLEQDIIYSPGNNDLIRLTPKGRNVAQKTYMKHYNELVKAQDKGQQKDRKEEEKLNAELKVLEDKVAGLQRTRVITYISLAVAIASLIVALYKS